MEFTLFNVFILELKIYCGPEKFYGRSKLGQYDEVKHRAPLKFEIPKYKQIIQQKLKLSENHPNANQSCQTTTTLAGWQPLQNSSQG